MVMHSQNLTKDHLQWTGYVLCSDNRVFFEALNPIPRAFAAFFL